MFPSTYSYSGPYPYFPSSSSSSSSSYHPYTFLNPENASSNNTFPHDPLSAIPYIPTTHHHAPIPETLTNFAVADYAAMFKNDVSGAHYGSISNLLTKKPASKKDRHSKIHTSQGLRDRRVRLSIEIARKFFDLQDMLGFDKASNTLEWLFNKSKKAMKELARSKNSSSCAANNSFSSSSECEEVVSVINQDATDEGVEVVESKEMKLKRAKMKESREKARARARERTSNKMCNTSGSVKVQDLKKKCPETENPQILHQLMRSSPFQPEDSARSPNKVLQPHNPHLVGNEVARDHDFNVIEESIVIKRKLKQSLMSSHHHQNLGIPREAGFSNSEHNSSFPNLSPNLDANGASRSNFCAIASMNLSTGLQIFGKSWEECTNPRL